MYPVHIYLRRYWDRCYDLAKNWRIFAQTTASFCINSVHYINFFRKTSIFCTKIAETCDHNIDPCLLTTILLLTSKCCYLTYSQLWKKAENVQVWLGTTQLCLEQCCKTWGRCFDFKNYFAKIRRF
jgi:hypothetical protein